MGPGRKFGPTMPATCTGKDRRRIEAIAAIRCWLLRSLRSITPSTKAATHGMDAMKLEANRRQRIVLKGLAVVLMLMLIFPPFVIDGSGGSVGLGFAFLLDPPEDRARMYVSQMLVQWIFAITIAAIALVLAKAEGPSESLG
jgi:hypothetical protein